MNETLDLEEFKRALGAAAEIAAKLIEKFIEAIMEFARQLAEVLSSWLGRLAPVLAIVGDHLKRHQVYCQLRSWRVPEFIAWPVARWCPRRFLSRLQAVY